MVVVGGAPVVDTVAFNLLVLGTTRMGLFPFRAMILLIRSQLDLAKVKLQGVAPVS